MRYFLSQLAALCGVAGAWQTAASKSYSAGATGWNGYTIRVRVDAASLTNITGSTHVRVTLQAAPAAGFTLDDVRIGHAAAAGDTYDFESTPTRVTFDGGNFNCAGAAGAAVVSDGVSFAVEADKALIVAVHFSAVSSASQVANAGGWSGFYKNANDAATVNATGYSNVSLTYMVSKIETFIPAS